MYSGFSVITFCFQKVQFAGKKCKQNHPKYICIPIFLYTFLFIKLIRTTKTEMYFSVF